MDVGNILRNARQANHLTLKDVAARVRVSESAVSRWETGDIKNMQKDKVMALSKTLGLEPSVIMGFDPLPSSCDSAPAVLSVFEMSLIKQYRKLNNTGKARLVEQAEMLIDAGCINNG